MSEFRETAGRIAFLARAEEIEIVPFKDERLLVYSALTMEEQEHSLWMAKNLLRVIETMQMQGERLSVSRRMVWHFLKMQKLVAPSDLFEHITESDTVDVYSEAHRLIFANLRFFDLCSYSLEELYCVPWRELFARDREEVNLGLMEIAGKLSRGEITGVYDTSYLGLHKGYEIMAPNRGYALVTPKVFCPVFSRQKFAGYVCVNHHEPHPNN